METKEGGMEDLKMYWKQLKEHSNTDREVDGDDVTEPFTVVEEGGQVGDNHDQDTGHIDGHHLDIDGHQLDRDGQQLYIDGNHLDIGRHHLNIGVHHLDIDGHHLDIDGHYQDIDGHYLDINGQ